MIMERTDEAFYTPKEVAKLLRVNVLTIYRWCNDGAIKSIRLPGGRSGGELRIPTKEVERILRGD